MSNWWKAALRWTVDIIACMVWSYIFVKLFVFDIDSYFVQRFAPSLAWAIKLKFVFFLLVVAFILALYKRPRIQLTALYILAFPAVVLLWKLPIAACKRWPVALACAPA